MKRAHHLPGSACFSTGIHFSVNDLVKAMFSQELDSSSSSELTCPNCGMDFAGISAVPEKLAAVYVTEFFMNSWIPFCGGFTAPVVTLARCRSKQGTRFALRMKVKGLRQELDRSVQCEDYENAAKIRDSIRSLEKELQIEGAGSDGQ